MLYVPLCSGSSGNAGLVRTGEATFLVDAGVTAKRIVQLLETAGTAPEELDGIFLTHSHIDHVRGVGVLSRKYRPEVFCSARCFGTLPFSVGEIPPDRLRIIEPDRAFFWKGLRIMPFRTPHDCEGSVGYSFRDDSGKLAVATDLGVAREEIFLELKDCDLVMLEANHDVDMLLSGPYPYPLKCRIRSELGHLSNEDAGRLAVRLAECGVRRFILGHLSAENNTPELAEVTVRSALRCAGFGDEVELTVAKRQTVTGTFSV